MAHPATARAQVLGRMDAFESELRADVGDISSLKALLGTVGQIRADSMAMDLAARELADRLRLLGLYR